VVAHARSCVSRVSWRAAGGAPLLSAQGESRSAIPSPPVAAATSGPRHTDLGRKRPRPARAVIPRGGGGSAASRLPHTMGRAACSWRWPLPLVCTAETRMGSLHGQQLAMRRYHTHGSKKNQINFQLVIIYCRISPLEIHVLFSGLSRGGTENGERLSLFYKPQVALIAICMFEDSYPLIASPWLTNVRATFVSIFLKHCLWRVNLSDNVDSAEE
jgi:hypothetical protein